MLKKIAVGLMIVALALPQLSAAASMGQRLKGKLLLQVEQGGRIWYVAPKDERRYEVTFANALDLFEEHALGITDANLAKIPLNTNTTSSTTFGKRFSGKLLLQVQQGGRIWYVDFNGRRWEVTWKNLMNLFKKLSLGISNNDLNKIPQEGDSYEDDDYTETTSSSSSTTSPQSSSTTTAPVQQVSSSKQALSRLLNENSALKPTEIASLYNALDTRDRNWFEIETRFTHFMQLLACQEVPNFVTKDYMGNVYNCDAIAQSFAQSLQYSTNDELVAAAEGSRQSILSSLGCESGAIDRSVCDLGYQTEQNFLEGDRQTFDTISDGFTSSNTCRVGIDPNCY